MASNSSILARVAALGCRTGLAATLCGAGLAAVGAGARDGMGALAGALGETGAGGGGAEAIFLAQAGPNANRAAIAIAPNLEKYFVSLIKWLIIIVFSFDS